MDKDIPNKRNPLMTGESGLSFDNILSEDITKLTDKQKAARFLSKYFEVVRPLTRFKEYFSSSAKTHAHIFKEIKSFYIKLVVTSKWSEKKFVACINDIFENKNILSVTTLDLAGIRYDKGLLSAQVRIKENERRGRI